MIYQFSLLNKPIFLFCSRYIYLIKSAGLLIHFHISFFSFFIILFHWNRFSILSFLQLSEKRSKIKECLILSTTQNYPSMSDIHIQRVHSYTNKTIKIYLKSCKKNNYELGKSENQRISSSQ